MITQFVCQKIRTDFCGCWQGCSEGVDPFLRIPYPWSAFHSDDYGYTRMTVHNASHVYMEQVSDDKVGFVLRSETLRLSRILSLICRIVENSRPCD